MIATIQMADSIYAQGEFAYKLRDGRAVIRDESKLLCGKLIERKEPKPHTPQPLKEPKNETHDCSRCSGICGNLSNIPASFNWLWNVCIHRFRRRYRLKWRSRTYQQQRILSVRICAQPGQRRRPGHRERLPRQYVEKHRGWQPLQPLEFRELQQRQRCVQPISRRRI